MNTDIVVFDADFVTLMKGSEGSGALPMPFAREILLLETCVAGTAYAEGIEEIGRDLSTGDLLVLRREPSNPYDEKAILILDGRGRKLGYVPRRKNEVLAHLMDAGKYIFAKVEEKQCAGPCLNVSVSVHMRDM
ncbi:MAG: HIRAN domain-containing protein [Candidatus Xenobiia bacterium LiM19]